jgi:hypothetical protein
VERTLRNSCGATSFCLCACVSVFVNVALEFPIMIFQHISSECCCFASANGHSGYKIKSIERFKSNSYYVWKFDSLNFPCINFLWQKNWQFKLGLFLKQAPLVRKFYMRWKDESIIIQVGAQQFVNYNWNQKEEHHGSKPVCEKSGNKEYERERIQTLKK